MEKMNKNEFIQQYGHTWRVFERLVQDFGAEAWLHTGRGAITPARLALHILLGTQYYLVQVRNCSFELAGDSHLADDCHLSNLCAPKLH